MIKINSLVLASIMFMPFAANAKCYGSDSYKTCYDDNGNTYDVSSYGNTTTVEGRASNGNRWSQESTRYGNTTETTGRAANGNRWNSTTTSYGNGQYSVQGRDADGNSFNRNCDQYGCN